METKKLARVIHFMDEMIERNERGIEQHRSVTWSDRCQGFADGQEIVLVDVKFVRGWLDDIVKELELKQ